MGRPRVDYATRYPEAVTLLRAGHRLSAVAYLCDLSESTVRRMAATLDRPAAADRGPWAVMMAALDASPSDVSRACGVSRMTAHLWLTGRAMPGTVERAEALAAAVGRPALVDVWRDCGGGR